MTRFSSTAGSNRVGGGRLVFSCPTRNGFRVSEATPVTQTVEPVPAVPAIPAPTQLRLLPAPQPLVERLGVEFFRTAPTEPGIYLMRDSAGALLYVGKAKNLRKRLNSYRSLTRASRKTRRLLHIVHGIAWEICESDTAAQLRENHLLRTLRPKFNRMNTWPKAYFYIVLRIEGTHAFELELTREVEGIEGAIHGAFKGGRLAFGALARLLWRSLNAKVSLEQLPRHFCLERPPARVRFETVADHPHAASLPTFLAGENDRLLAVLKESLPAPASPFENTWLTEDLALLETFYARHLVRHRSMRQRLKPGATWILQEELDDFLVQSDNSEAPAPDSSSDRKSNLQH